MLGVRPEALSRAADDAVGALVGRVAFVEDFGATQLVASRRRSRAAACAKWQSNPTKLPSAPRLRALLDTSRPVRMGERLRLSIDPRRVHLFDPDSEHAL